MQCKRLLKPIFIFVKRIFNLKKGNIFHRLIFEIIDEREINCNFGYDFKFGRITSLYLCTSDMTLCQVWRGCAIQSVANECGDGLDGVGCGVLRCCETGVLALVLVTRVITRVRFNSC